MRVLRTLSITVAALIAAPLVAGLAAALFIEKDYAVEREITISKWKHAHKIEPVHACKIEPL